MKCFLVLLNLLVFSFGLYPSTTMTMNYGGVQRSFIVHLPSSYSAGQHLPLVFNFHGYTSTAAQQEIYSQMDNTSDDNNFIVVYPDGIANAWNVGWTGAYFTGTDDVGFVSAMIDTMQLLYGADLNRVYATGLSNGGFLSHRLACELDNRIAAVAPVAGTLTDSTAFYCHPSRKVPIMHVHGTSDPIVAYAGVVGSLSVEQTITFWLNKYSCSRPGDTTNLPNTNTNDASTVQKINYPVCSPGFRFLFYKITGGGHTWPNGAIDIPSFGATNRDMTASTEIWNFFKQYTLNGTTGIEPIDDNSPKVNIYPNPFNDEIKIDAGVMIERIEMFNVMGEKVYSQVVDNSYSSVNLVGISSGIYFLKISGKDFTRTEKICKN